jgi:hypothetical protein
VGFRKPQVKVVNGGLNQEGKKQNQNEKPAPKAPIKTRKPYQREPSTSRRNKNIDKTKKKGDRPKQSVKHHIKPGLQSLRLIPSAHNNQKNRD